MRCTHCGWPAAEATVLSAHLTSEGWVRYRRCVCGAVSVELVGGKDERHLRAEESVRRCRS